MASSDSPSSPSSGNAGVWPWAAMALAPLFFSTNLVFGRSLADEMNPFLLAFLRWLLVALLLTPFVWRERDAAIAIIRAHLKLLLLLGFLGMWIAGAVVYLGLQHTTAINGTLIYTTSPVIILLIEAVVFGRMIGRRELAGALIAFCGVALIILKGDISALLQLSFNIGDLLVALAAIAWAAYSVLYRSAPLKAVSNMALFGMVAWAGTLCLAPALPVLAAMGLLVAPEPDSWPRIAGVVFFSSIAAFGLYQYGVRQLGASLAGIFMYLLPPYGVLLAMVTLGERLETYHLAGIAAVLTGIMLATFPVGLFKR
jgi:drug/metabolite transporter (DMT)-like permease